jgi:hypothetical protein
MKVFTVVVIKVTDKLKKLKKNIKGGHCESEEFWAGPLFWVLWRLNWCPGAGWLLWVASSGSAGRVVFWILMVFSGGPVCGAGLWCRNLWIY